MKNSTSSTGSLVVVLILGAALFLASHFLSERPPEKESQESQTPYSLELLNSVLWIQTAGERRALTIQIYRQAKSMLDAALDDPDWTAALEQGGGASKLPPAIVLDVDETVLDNSAYQAQLILENTRFERPTWHEWCDKESAPPIPGALELTQYAAERGVEVMYLTNRRHEVEGATRNNLAKLGFPLNKGVDTLYTRGEKEEWDVSDKSSRRADIASRYRVLLLIGDDLNDFVSGTRSSLAERDAVVAEYDEYWGTKWFVLPNPEYGGWEGALSGFQRDLSPSEQLQVKLDALRLP
jgi:acid phosphatase